MPSSVSKNMGHVSNVPVLALVVVASWTTPALGHNIQMFATVNGTKIEGRAYTSDLSPVADAAVTLFSAGGQQLQQTTTDADGQFTFSVEGRGDYQLVLSAPGGHRAEFPIGQEEFSSDVPASNQSEAPSAAPAAESAAGPSTQQPTVQQPSQAPSAAGESLGSQIDDLRRQVVELRQQIDSYEHKTRWHDVLGGLGYILGIVGVAYYFLGVRRKQHPPA